MTALGVLCCFTLFVCLTLLASFFLPSHLSFKNEYYKWNIFGIYIYPDLATTPTYAPSYQSSCGHVQQRVIVIGLCVSRSVGECICPLVFSRTVAMVDTKHGYVQQAFGTDSMM